MHLANGGWAFFIFTLTVLVASLVVFSFYRKNRLIRSLFSKSQQDLLLSNLNRPARVLKTLALTLAVFFIGFSVLDPRWGTKNVQADIEGIDIVFIMDISRSMSTPDVQPSRLEVSKNLSVQLMNLLLGSRMGVTAFAGYAFNVIPLTSDVNAAAIFLNELSPDMIDVQGTNLEDAIRKALLLFEKDALTHKAIVIFTDGEDRQFNPMEQVRLAKEKGITIFTVGIGTPNGGSIPLYDANGNQVDTLKKDGNEVVSRLNEALLTKIAEETKGFYVHGDDGSVIALSRKLDEIKKSRFGSNLYEFMEPQYQYFLFMGLLLLFISVFLPDRRIPRMPGTAGTVLLVLFLFSFHPVYGSDASRGCGEYRKGNYDQALDLFRRSIVKDPAAEKVRFNEGDTLLKMKNSDEAVRSFGSLAFSKDKNIRSKAYYNLGNAYLEKGDVQNALESYKAVLQSEKKDSELYKKALNNILYAKVQPPQPQDKKQDQDKNDQKNNDRDKNKKKNKDDKQQQKEQQQANPISPTQVDNLLNLIEEEEKKHISRKELKKGVKVYPQDEW